MTKQLCLVLAVVLGAAGCLSVRASITAPAAKPAERVLRHVVLLKFMDDTTADQIAAVERRFLELEDAIDVIEDLEGGADVSDRGLNQGFTHGFIVTFTDEAGLEAYLPHAAHQAFVAYMRPYLDEVLVIDFWAP